MCTHTAAVFYDFIRQKMPLYDIHLSMSFSEIKFIPHGLKRLYFSFFSDGCSPSTVSFAVSPCTVCQT